MLLLGVVVWLLNAVLLLLGVVVAWCCVLLNTAVLNAGVLLGVVTIVIAGPNREGIQVTSVSAASQTTDCERLCSRKHGVLVPVTNKPSQKHCCTSQYHYSNLQLLQQNSKNCNSCKLLYDCYALVVQQNSKNYHSAVLLVRNSHQHHSTRECACLVRALPYA